jgi:23S rRNA (cytidine1920-2'-O)/16S rRNA (cytidine1409-2'-O)-methyltransferase
MPRIRADQAVVQQQLAESREQAQRLIRAGAVRLNGHPLTKPGQPIDPAAPLELQAAAPFVSRGGEKLAEAFRRFPIDVHDLATIDVGASTGGFTDCLLQHGARLVYAVDVGKGQLHWKLRQDPRVQVMENINARYLEPAAFAEPPRFAVVDVSFISLTKILPALKTVLGSDAACVTLIKPQFEAGRADVGKGGVVRDPAVHQRVLETIRQFGETELGWRWQDCCPSPIRGPAGNTEFLAYWKTACESAS